jgi:hypothetical protein
MSLKWVATLYSVMTLIEVDKTGKVDQVGDLFELNVKLRCQKVNALTKFGRLFVNHAVFTLS